MRAYGVYCCRCYCYYHYHYYYCCVRVDSEIQTMICARIHSDMHTDTHTYTHMYVRIGACLILYLCLAL